MFTHIHIILACDWCYRYRIHIHANEAVIELKKFGDCRFTVNKTKLKLRVTEEIHAKKIQTEFYCERIEEISEKKNCTVQGVVEQKKTVCIIRWSEQSLILTNSLESFLFQRSKFQVRRRLPRSFFFYLSRLQFAKFRHSIFGVENLIKREHFKNN